jgi:hypothetical protein
MKSKEQIKMILADCNFKRIHSVMNFLNWKWTYSNGEKKVPPVADLISVAEDCLNNVVNSEDKSVTCSVGGFEAEKIDGILELRFNIERVNPLSSILNSDAKQNKLVRKTK